ncbi:LysM peptidoglycan-binding domain-containing protein, partial [Oenococcus oeni]
QGNLNNQNGNNQDFNFGQNSAEQNQSFYQQFNDQGQQSSSDKPEPFFASNKYSQSNQGTASPNQPQQQDQEQYKDQSNFGKPKNGYNPNNYQKSSKQNKTDNQKNGTGFLSKLNSKVIIAFAIATLVILLAIPTIGSIAKKGDSSKSVASSTASVTKKSSSSSASSSSAASSSQSSAADASSSTAAADSSSTEAAESSSSVTEDSSAETSSSSTATTYTVQSGDSAYHIASLYGLTVEELYELNGLTPGSTLLPGQVLKVSGN